MDKPTIAEVRAYIVEKGWFTVSAQEFIDVNEGSDWHDKNGKPYRYWKRVLATWYHNSLRFGDKPKLCRMCKKYGCYPGKDDTGQQYWLCEDHKPGFRPKLPEELTKDVLKTVESPTEGNIRRINDERNRQRKGLGIA